MNRMENNALSKSFAQATYFTNYIDDEAITNQKR